MKSKLFLLLGLGALSLFGAFYFLGGFSSGGIGLDVSLPEKAPRLGAPFDLKVDFTNDSRNVMKEVRLTLKFKSGAVPFSGENVTVEERNLGEIKPGGVHQESFRVVATPAEGKTREFIVTASYSPESLIAHFEKSKNISVDVEDSGLSLDLKVPTKVFSGEEFEINLDYKKEANDPLNYKIKMEYPSTFTPTGFNATPYEGNNVWKLTKDEGKLTIRGKVDLPDESNFTIRANIASTILSDEYTFLSKSTDVSIAESPLSFKVSLADPSKVAYYPGEQLDYTLSYKNNTQVELQGLVVRAQLIGAMYDFETLKSQGTFSNISNTITWDSKSLSDLKSVGAGDGGAINFSIKLKGNYPIKRLSDKNFTLKVKGRIESPTVPYLISSDKTVSSAILETKVGGKIAVETKGYFRDADSGILNSGPLPPKVGTATDFTVHLILTNFSTDLTGVEVKVPLQDGIVFTGQVKGNTTSLPEVSETGEVVWRIDRLFATMGITGEHPEVVFQVRATPGSNQAGGYMPLLGETRVKARDEFIGIDIDSSYSSLTTRLPDDPTVSERDGIVIQ